jgi:threonine dehydrogenase-like Zn-dependent dehydrogenase
MMCYFHYFQSVILSGLVLAASSSSSSSSSPPLGQPPTSALLVLDVDNTLYREKEASIEAQIVRNTHQYCEEHLNLSKEQADDLFRVHGSTVEGLKETLWKDYPREKRQEELRTFYHVVYKDLDVSRLLPASNYFAGGSTGYSHASAAANRNDVLRTLLKSSPHDMFLASNSPSWHVRRVLQAMGLASLEWKGIFTPDRLPHADYPTKNTPKAFFYSPYSSHKNLQGSMDRPMLIMDDSKHNLERIQSAYSNISRKIHITDNHTLADALFIACGLVDPAYSFSQVDYLESKNVVDRQSIHKETWHRVLEQLQSLGQQEQPIRIVDVGAGLLSMLQLFCMGDVENGLRPLLLDNGQEMNLSSIQLDYTAYESNRALLEACQERLRSWGFTLQEQVSDKEFIYVHPNNVRLRLCFMDYGSDHSSQDAPSPHLIVGCCFADLLDPHVLVPSLIRQFDLLRDTSNTLLYFPITFTGTTQFVPPRPFVPQRKIPSDTMAFGLYGQALEETMGHNLDPLLLQQVMQDYGATLIAQGASNWNVAPDAHSYLFETMLYFFGTAGGPQLLTKGWDARAWLYRAKQNRPNIQVSNVDLLFSIGQQQTVEKQEQEKETSCPRVTANKKAFQEILFTAPQTVTAIQKTVPKLGPTQVLVESVCSLISSGSELKIFKGSFDDAAALDVNIKGMEHERMAYPLAYGYSLVGRVTECGSDVSNDYLGKLVFTFSPHATHVVTDISAVQLVPEGVAPEDAIFMPSVETALSIVHDAHVRVGENVAVHGQGLIGLLVTSVLRMHNHMAVASGRFGTITVFDTLPDRLAMASRMGASQALLPGSGTNGLLFDVSIEISGNARALQSAIDHTADGGRIIVGSWYGTTNVQLLLGIEFHRSHKTIQTSQVSDIPAHLLGLWNKERRFSLTWELVQQIRPSKLITKRLKLDKAQEAYEALDNGTEIAIAFIYRS